MDTPGSVSFVSLSITVPDTETVAGPFVSEDSLPANRVAVAPKIKADRRKYLMLFMVIIFGVKVLPLTNPAVNKGLIEY
jgi:hypothetical protein